MATRTSDFPSSFTEMTADTDTTVSETGSAPIDPHQHEPSTITVRVSPIFKTFGVIATRNHDAPRHGAKIKTALGLGARLM